jgi:hypothetical protein
MHTVEDGATRSSGLNRNDENFESETLFHRFLKGSSPTGCVCYAALVDGIFARPTVVEVAL